MGNATSNKFEGSTNTTQNTTDIDGKKKAPVKKPEVGKSNLQGGSSHATGGWFGGIFSKLSMKPKNQMILPDDKNPTVSYYGGKCFKVVIFSLFRFYGMRQQKNGSTRTKMETKLRVSSRRRKWVT